VVGAQVPQKLPAVPRRAAKSVREKERRFIPGWLHSHQGREAGALFLGFEEKIGLRFDRARLEDQRGIQRGVELAAHLRDQMDCLDGLSSNVEKVLITSYRLRSQDLHPDGG
jgi:hypothetical protein